MHLLDKKSLFSRKNDKTPAKLVVRDVRDIKVLDCRKTRPSRPTMHPNGIEKA